MKVLVRLLPLDHKAKDGSLISKKVFLEYLNSQDYKDRKRANNFLGGSTHFHRNSSKKTDEGGVLGESDKLLLSGNVTHIIREFMVDTDPEDGKEYIYCIVEIMDDPEEYEGESKVYIKTLLRLIRRGVMLTTSIVVNAWWSKTTNEAMKIGSISGLDFTLSPGYNRSGIVKILED